MKERVMIDVNIPMYSVGREHRYKTPCVWVLSEIAEGRMYGVIDAEIIQEIFHRYGSIKRWETGVFVAERILLLVEEIIPILPDHVRYAIDLFQQYGPAGIPSRDIIHASVMALEGIQKIVSTDSHFDRIQGIERLDPVKLFQKRRE